MRKPLLIAFLACVLAASVVQIMSGRPAAASATDPVVVAAGDIACPPGAAVTSTTCHQAKTASLLAGADAVLPVGDTQYLCGRPSDYPAYDATWGAYKSISHPVVGDNEYAQGSSCVTPGAAGYFGYFGSIATPSQPGCTSACGGYYSYDLGSWHLVALNAECSQAGSGGCSSTSAQVQWLKADLAANAGQCTLAYWHQPKWGNGKVSSSYDEFVKALYAAHASIVLNGHWHLNARFPLQDPASHADPNGIREFVVGSGGYNHASISSGVYTMPNPPQYIDNKNFGVLKLGLHAGSYDWRFVNESGTVLDSGSQACSGGSSATTTTTAPPTTTTVPTTTTTGPTTTTTGPTTTTTGATTTTAAGGTNLIGNPGFESGTSGWAPNGTGVTLATSPVSRTGASSALLSNSSTSTQCRLDDKPNWVAVTQAGTYTASLWAKADAAGAQLTLRLRENASSGGTVQTRSASIALGTSWQQVSVQLVPAQPGSSSIDINAFTPSGATGSCFYADDASMTVQ